MSHVTCHMLLVPCCMCYVKCLCWSWDVLNNFCFHVYAQKFTLVDHLDTSREELEREGHTSGATCKCRVCLKLKELEDKFILKSGTFYGNGLNSRNELENKTRSCWKWCYCYCYVIICFVLLYYVLYCLVRCSVICVLTTQPVLSSF